jgi:DNA-binding MarR family transcriptional regulator
MTSPGADAHAREAFSALLHAAESQRARLERALEAVGLSHPKYEVLTHLVRAGEPLPLSEVAARLSCVRSNVTQLVDRLEAEGLVRRVHDPRDRRSVLAELTDDGSARQREGAAAVAEVHAAFAASLTPDEQRTLARTLAALG